MSRAGAGATAEAVEETGPAADERAGSDMGTGSKLEAAVVTGVVRVRPPKSGRRARGEGTSKVYVRQGRGHAGALQPRCASTAPRSHFRVGCGSPGGGA